MVNYEINLKTNTVIASRVGVLMRTLEQKKKLKLQANYTKACDAGNSSKANGFSNHVGHTEDFQLVER